MNEIELRYRQSLQDADQKDLEAYAKQAVANPQAPIFDRPSAPLQQETKPSESIIYKGVKAAGEMLGPAGAKIGKGVSETAIAGYTHFMNGVYRAVGNNLDYNQPVTPGAAAGEIFSGMGESLLGGLTLLSVLPQGAGDAAQEFLKIWIPGIENHTALPGPVAGIIRQMLAAPLLLDPKVREIFQNSDTAKAFMAELHKPMTAGELTNTIAQFAMFAKQGKIASDPFGFRGPMGSAVKGGFAREPVGAPSGGPLDVKAATVIQSQLALPPGRDVKALGPYARPMGPGESMTPEAVAARLQVLSEELRGGGEAKPTEPSAGEKPSGQTSTTEPGLKIEKATETSEEGRQYYTLTAGDSSMQVDHIAADKELYVDMMKGKGQGGVSLLYGVKKLAGDLGVEKITADTANPKLIEFLKNQGAASETFLEPDKPGGTAPQRVTLDLKNFEQPKKPETPKLAETYAQGLKGSIEKGVDIATEMFTKIVDELNVQEQKLLKAMSQNLGDESGRVSAGLLARMAVGAAIGGSQGDTPEERVKYALAGILGAAIAGRLAKSLVTAFAKDAPHILDDVNPRVPGYTTIPETRVKLPVSGDMTVAKLISMDQGEVLTASDMQHARHIEVQSVQQVFDLAKAIKSGEAVPQGDLKQAIAITRSVSAALEGTRENFSNLGRGIEGRVRAANRHIDRLALEWDQATPEPVLADILTSFPRKEQISLFSRLYYAIPEAIAQEMYGATLSGKVTEKHALGTIAQLPLNAVNRSLAALKFWDPKAPSFDQGMMGFISIWDSLHDQFRLIKNDGWVGLGAQAEKLGSNTVDKPVRGFQAVADIATESGAPMLGKGIEWIGHAADLGPGAIARVVGISKALQGNMAVTWEAMQHARLEDNLSGQAYWDRVRDIKNDYSQLTNEALVRIKNFRDSETYTQPFENDILKKLQAGPDDPVANLMYRMTIGTFVRTPLRIMEIGAEYTPGLNFLAPHFYAEWNKGGTSRAMAEARVATGLAIMGTVMYGTGNGVITPDAPTDPREAKALVDAGMPPRSFWDPLSEKWRSYDGLGPVSVVIATSANLATMTSHLEENKMINLMLAGGLAMWRGVGSEHYMKSWSDFFDALKVGRTDSMWEGSMKYIRSRMDMMIPQAGREIAGAVDPVTRRVLPNIKYDDPKRKLSDIEQAAVDAGLLSKKAVNSIEREWQLLVDDTKKAVPGWSDVLKPGRNMFTGEVIPISSWPFNPMTTKPGVDAPWAKAIRRLDGAGLQPPSGWIGHKDPADIGSADVPSGAGVRLTGTKDGELDRLEILMTQVVRDAHGNLVQSLNQLVQDKTFLRQPDVVQKEMIQSRYHSFMKSAEEKLIAEKPALRRALENKEYSYMQDRLPKDDPRRVRKLDIGVKP